MIKLPLNIDYSGKVVVVTGAGGLICGAMARAFAQCGAKVAALDLNEEAVKKLADELVAEGFVCKGYKANVLDSEALEQVHQAVLADLGPCDILVNGAGGNNPRATTDNEYHHEAQEGKKSFFDLDSSGVDFVFKLNFQGTLLPTQAFAKDMCAKKSGCILNISSTFDKNSRIFRSKSRHFQLYTMACNSLCRNRHPLQCNCSRIFGFRTKQGVVVQPRRNTNSTFGKNFERHTHKEIC